LLLVAEGRCLWVSGDAHQCADRRTEKKRKNSHHGAILFRSQRQYNHKWLVPFVLHLAMGIAWTKRGQPELSDFSCTILAHATAKSMCLARSALPHHSRLTWPVRSSRFSEACENKKQIAQFRLSPFYSVHSSICLLSAISLGTHGFRSFDISSECAKP